MGKDIKSPGINSTTVLAATEGGTLELFTKISSEGNIAYALRQTLYYPQLRSTTIYLRKEILQSLRDKFDEILKEA